MELFVAAWSGKLAPVGRRISVECRVHRAHLSEIQLAFDLVSEYCQEMRVEVREDREEFERQYFDQETGLWLAEVAGAPAGCVALRKLDARQKSGEIKRMYVHASLRGKGIADMLLRALEAYAKECGYEWLYLDTMLSMEAAARFYERNSYLRCERYNDNPQAGLFMRKQLIANRLTMAP
jgi:ribosomal protein S18 acetylase RimI-like enzyme